MRTALITGIIGQDGSYLSELLLRKGYRVIGTEPFLETVGFDRIKNMGEIEFVADDLQE